MYAVLVKRRSCNNTRTSNCQWVAKSTKALACVSLGSLMSLSQPGSHEEISFVTNLDLSDTSGVTCLVRTWLETRGSGNHYFCFQNAFYMVKCLLIHGNVCAIAPDPLQHHILARVDKLRLKPCGWLSRDNMEAPWT